jgi:hypothetical protein
MQLREILTKPHPNIKGRTAMVELVTMMHRTGLKGTAIRIGSAPTGSSLPRFQFGRPLSAATFQDYRARWLPSRSLKAKDNALQGTGFEPRSPLPPESSASAGFASLGRNRSAPR